MKDPIVILHGWGSTVSGERYKQAKELLEKEGFLVFTPDMPGFGCSRLKKEELYFEDYVAYVADFLKKKKLKKVTLLGHSFGGRVAIRFTTLHPQYVSGLILVGSSGIPHPLPSLKKKVIYIATKVVKPIFAIPPFSLLYTFFRKIVYYSIGEMDYYKSGKLSKTFQNVYQVSVAEDLAKITVPTLIVWGENDTITPVADGVYIHEHIKNSQLILVKDAGHKLPYENANILVRYVLNFLK